MKLPFAKQTHEVCYEPESRCLFVSQMSNSVLVRIPVMPADGLLGDDQDTWQACAAGAITDPERCADPWPHAAGGRKRPTLG